MKVYNLSLKETNQARFRSKRLQQKVFRDTARVRGWGKQHSLRRPSSVVIRDMLNVEVRQPHSGYPGSYSHPAIMPDQYPVTDLIIARGRNKKPHLETSHIPGTTKEQYWMANGSGTLREVIECGTSRNNCICISV